MAVIAPMAEWRPLDRAVSSTLLVHDIICLHTMVGTLGGSWDWSNRPRGSYWTFGIGGGGACWQCHDLRTKSAANLNGNWHVIPIETEDHGPYFGPWSGHCGDVPGWTNAQIDKIVELVAWLCARYHIPPVLIPDTQRGRRGIAYHKQGIDPWRHANGELWSNAYGKCCPDHRRIWQLINIVIPRVQEALNSGGSFMAALSDKEQKELLSKVRAVNKTINAWPGLDGKLKRLALTLGAGTGNAFVSGTNIKAWRDKRGWKSNADATKAASTLQPQEGMPLVGATLDGVRQELAEVHAKLDELLTKE